MIFGFNIRLLVYVRRGVRSLESISKSLEAIARVQEDEWSAKHAPKKPIRMEMGSLDIAEVNKRYAQERKALMLDEDEQ